MLVWLCCAGVVHAGTQSPPAPASPVQPTFRTETTLVEVSAVVVDRAGTPVLDLAADDFEVLEDGEPRPLVGFRQVVSGTERPGGRVDVAGARYETLATNVGLADAPVFVLLLDDLNIRAIRAHRAIRGATGLLEAIPAAALVAVVSTSGIGGSHLTLTPRNAGHLEHVRALRGQLIEGRPSLTMGAYLTTPSSAVGMPCGVGSHARNSLDCVDPMRAVRRLETVRAVANLLSAAGSRRKVLFWVTEDMGATPLDPDVGRRTQRDALQAVLAADVAVYPVHPDELPFAPDNAPGSNLVLGGNIVSVDNDEHAGVTLDQMARESGGRWIVNINDHQVVLADVVRQNSAAYMLAYDSPVARDGGRHRIDVRVGRGGLRVYARRGYITPHTPSPVARADGTAASTSPEATLGELLRGVVPQGQLAITTAVTATPVSGKEGQAMVVVHVDAATSQAQPVHMALMTFDADGRVSSQRAMRFDHPSTHQDWEVSFELPLARGQHQLRVAAVTADGLRSGLVTERITVETPGRSLSMDAPMLVAIGGSPGARTRQFTLRRTFDIGSPIVVQTHVTGRAAADGRARVSLSLVDAHGTTVARAAALIEPGEGRGHARVTGVLSTRDVSPGAYALIVEASDEQRGAPVRHAIQVRMEE